MPSRRPVQLLICLSLAVAPGCQTFFPYRPVTILTRDAETGRPIADAHLHISYPLVHPSQSPYESSDATGADGLAHLQAAPFGAAGVLVEVKAKGYLLEQKTLKVAEVEKLKTAGWFENVERRPADFIIDVYAEPRPVVELRLPPSFHGLIKAEVQVRADAPCPAGQRVFRYDVSMDGKVQVVGPPLVERVVPLDYQAVNQDGIKLCSNAEGLELGFYAVKSDARFITFFVGTRNEFEALRRAELQNDGNSGRGRSSGGGGGGNSGRRGGKRGQPPTDPVNSNPQ
jgi:hypothetical protein